jgi:hypothetical protein
MVRDCLAIVEAYEPQFPTSRFIQKAEGMLAEIHTPIHFDDARGEEVFDMSAVQKWLTHLVESQFYLDASEVGAGADYDRSRDGPTSWFQFACTHALHQKLTRAPKSKVRKIYFQFTVTLFNNREDKHPSAAHHVDLIYEWYRSQALYWPLAAQHFTIEYVGGEMFEAAISMNIAAMSAEGADAVEEELMRFVECDGADPVSIDGVGHSVMGCLVGVRIV